MFSSKDIADATSNSLLLWVEWVLELSCSLLKKRMMLAETADDEDIAKALVRRKIAPWPRPQGPEDLSRHGLMGDKAILESRLDKHDVVTDMLIMREKLCKTGHYLKALERLEADQ